jgi:hypothetical protein
MGATDVSHGMVKVRDLLDVIVVRIVTQVLGGA